MSKPKRKRLESSLLQRSQQWCGMACRADARASGGARARMLASARPSQAVTSAGHRLCAAVEAATARAAGLGIGQGDIQSRRRHRLAGRERSLAGRRSRRAGRRRRHGGANERIRRPCGATSVSRVRRLRRGAACGTLAAARATAKARVRRRHTRHRRAGHRGCGGAAAVRISARGLEPDAKDTSRASTAMPAAPSSIPFSRAARCWCACCR